MKQGSEDGVDITNLFVILTIIFLAIVVRSCMLEKSPELCRQLCIGRGEEYKESDNRFWFVSCTCGSNSKAIRLHNP